MRESFQKCGLLTGREAGILFLDWVLVELQILVLIRLLLERNAKEFLIPSNFSFKPTKKLMAVSCLHNFEGRRLAGVTRLWPDKAKSQQGLNSIRALAVLKATHPKGLASDGRGFSRRMLGVFCY